MSRYGGPKIPRSLLDQIDVKSQSRRPGPSRKEVRKAERQQKKAWPHDRPQARPSKPVARPPRNVPVATQQDDSGFDDSSPSPEPVLQRPSAVSSKPLKSILKTKTQVDSPQPSDHFDADDASDASSFVVSARAAREGLAGDDAEIAALEKKLGINGKKKLKNKKEDDGDDADGFDWLLGGADSESEGERTSRKRKRAEDDQWLREKRSKANGKKYEHVVAEEEDDSDELDDEEQDKDLQEDGESNLGDLENPYSEDELDSDDFDGLDDSEDDVQESATRLPQKKPRENPYVAPVSADTAPAKYVPPSLRQAPSSDDEALKQLRRQIQGQLNRLSEANILSILQAIEGIYEKNARQHVTSALIELLTSLIAHPSVLNDIFLILHAAFSTALYKVIGIDCAAQVLESLVKAYGEHEGDDEGKYCLNILAFLSNLYNLQMIASTIIFDYIRDLLGNFSEKNAELLLRIIRTSGPQLRRDDPSSLKDIVLLLHRFIAERGEANLSVRTRFMIETINDLKNNKLKAGVAASALAVDHTARMKKTLGTLNTRAKTKEPLRISLADINDSEKKGKWWLVGASYHDPAKMANGNSTSTNGNHQTYNNNDDGYESDTPGHVNLQKLARQLGMNTDIRRAICITLLDSVDITHAHMRLVKLNLKSKQRFEIPRVIVHCLRAELVYNPYYANIAKKFCGDHQLRKAYSFILWDALKEMDACGDAADEDDDPSGAVMTIRRIVKLAKFYATLVVSKHLDLAILKRLDFADLAPKTQTFVNAFLTTIFTQARTSSEAMPKVIKEVLGNARRAPEMIEGLFFFVKEVVSQAGLAKGKKEKATVKDGSSIAVEILGKMLAEGVNKAHQEDEEETGSDYSD